MRPACVSSPKSAKICELPKVFLAKRRNICVSPTLAVLDAAVGHIGPIGHIGRRLTPLCTAPFHRPAGALLQYRTAANAALYSAFPSPRRGAPASPESPESPDPGRGRVSALWHVADVPGVQGKVEVWKLRGLEAWLSQRPCPSRACRAFSVLRSLFSVLRGAPAPLGPSCPS